MGVIAAFTRVNALINSIKGHINLSCFYFSRELENDR